MPNPAVTDLSRLTRTLVRSTDRSRRVGGPTAAVLGVGAIGAVTAIDLATGPYISLLIGYAAVVLAAGWRSTRSVAVVLSLLSAAGTALAAGLDPDDRAGPAIILLNALLRASLLAILGVGAWLLHATLRELSAAARRDPLTGLYNRNAVFELAEHERARSLRTSRPMTVGYFDLDGLKAINDERGHDAGDELIVRFAHALADGLRVTDHVARLGGDEFVVVLPETDEDAARRAVARVLDDPSTPRASCGLVTFPRPEAPVAQLVVAADELMYEVKRHGHGLRATTSAPESRSTPHPG